MAKKSFIEYLMGPDGDAAPLKAALKAAMGIGAEFDAAVQLVVDTAEEFGDVAGAVAATEAQVALATVQRILADADKTQTGLDVLTTANNVALVAALKVLAQAAADASFVNANTYPTEALGRAAVANGVQFSCISADMFYVERRLRVDSATSTVVNQFPTGALFKAIIDYVSDTNVVLTPPLNALVASGEVVVATILGDAAGIAPAYMTSTGTIVIEALRPHKVDYMGGMLGTVYAEANYYYAIVDSNDNVLLGISSRGFEVYGLASAGAASLQASDLANKVAAQTIQFKSVLGLQQSQKGWNLILIYGQSLAEGQEAWPTVTKAQKFGNLMLGQDTRPAARDGTTWAPKGTNTPQPLIPRVISSTGVLLTDAEVAALTAGDSAPGEDVGIGLANMASLLISRLTYADPKPFVVMNAAVSGKSIEQLSKVNTEDGTLRYGRFTGAVDAFVSAAVTAGQTKACTAIVYMQGENDYVSTTGTLKATRALYRAALNQLLLDTVADIKSRTGQTDDPLFLIYQTGAGYARDTDVNNVPDLHVGMAQWQFALANPKRVGMFSPVYPVTDKGGHLDSNGERWLAMQAAKVYKRMVVDGQEWRPLSPRRIEVVDTRTVRIHFHVPQPPLNFASVYAASVATLYSGRGFRVSDGSGDKVLSSVSIVADTIVEIKTTTDVDMANALIWYASKTTYSGNGNLCDSDGTVASEVYEYLPASGMYAAANIGALVGSPYPLNNWCVAFCLPTTYTES